MERFRKLPLPALLPVMFVLLAAIWFGIQFVTRSAHQDVGALLIGSVLYAGMMTAFFGIAIARRRRAAGGADAVASMARTIKTGQLPGDADAATWKPELERYRVRYRRNRWAVPVMCVVFAALCVYLAVPDQPVWWAFLVVFAAFCAYAMWETRRALRNLDTALAELQQRPQWTVDGPAASPGATWTLPNATR
jgi:hypothetical protein